jgi:hypothetical protein
MLSMSLSQLGQQSVIEQIGPLKANKVWVPPTGDKSELPYALTSDLPNLILQSVANITCPIPGSFIRRGAAGRNRASGSKDWNINKRILTWLIAIMFVKTGRKVNHRLLHSVGNAVW